MSKELDLEIYDIVKIEEGNGCTYIESINEIHNDENGKLAFTDNFVIDLKKVDVTCVLDGNPYQLEMVWRLDGNRNYTMIYPIQRLEQIDNFKKNINSLYSNMHQTSDELDKSLKDSLLKNAKIEAIENANPSEALECLERIDNTLCLNNIKGKLEFGIDTEEHNDCDSVIGMTEDLETIKQALQQKTAWKHIHNTKVRVPLIQIFNGKSQEERHQIIEHIYYHWEEMKESLEAEIETIKVEKENLKLEAQKQKHKVEKLTNLPFKERRKIGQEYIKWCKKNNAVFDDATNMITWVLCIKLKEVLNENVK